MIIIMIVVGYLLIGAILGLNESQEIEEHFRKGLVNVPPERRRLMIVGGLIVIVMGLPIINLLDLIMKLKPKRKSSKK